MESFRSKQFKSEPGGLRQNPLQSHSRKMCPELNSFINLQLKQEKLLKLERENHPEFGQNMTCSSFNS